MDYDGIDLPYGKYADWVIYGPAIAPDLAVEIIRRTDAFFTHGGSYSPYQSAVRTVLGVPSEQDYHQPLPDGGYRVDNNALFEDLLRFQNRWQWLNWTSPEGDECGLHLLTNGQIAGGRGWCFPDGTIALCEQIKRGYPTQIWEECEALAATFPELEFSAAYWVRDVDTPSAGFIIRDGMLRGLRGDDPELFGHLTPLAAKAEAEQATRVTRDKLPEFSKFGDRTPTQGPLVKARGLPDTIIEDWGRKARELGLAGDMEASSQSDASA
ncbi:MAG TPA: hypothetical protein PK417_02770 [Hyphomonas sp.]|nr:hypothetical protein [Hyphomonas sp.]HRX72704.1 hypothetical protein [Hyphomonas sp.]